MQILIVDGQGGGLGRQLTEAILRAEIPCNIRAVGANAAATAAMLKAGAQQGATGENAVKVCAGEADVIIGPVGIAIAHSMLGEITPKMAKAIGKSKAVKLLLPVNHCNNIIVGTEEMNLKALIADTIRHLQRLTKNENM